MNKLVSIWRAGALCAVAGSLVAVLACNDEPTGLAPGAQVPESQLEFVPRAATAPPLVTLDTSFYAVKGESRELEIRYQGQGGPGTGKKFLELKVDNESLLRRPDGTAFADGDSVLIRVTVDTVFFLASLQPSGLSFDPAEPAVLEITYDEAENDFVVREAEFDLWRQENPGAPWELLGSVQLADFDEIEAQLLGFTRYALAIGR